MNLAAQIAISSVDKHLEKRELSESGERTKDSPSGDKINSKIVVRKKSNRSEEDENVDLKLAFRVARGFFFL